MEKFIIYLEEDEKMTKVFKEFKSESGVSTVGFLTTIMTIAFFTVSVATFNINDAKAKVDRSVEFDIKNIAAQTNVKIHDENSFIVVDNQLIGHDNSGFSMSENSPITKGTSITATGTSEGYCLLGSNPSGDKSSENRYVYASLSGGFNILYDGQNCKDGLVETIISDQ